MENENDLVHPCHHSLISNAKILILKFWKTILYWSCFEIILAEILVQELEYQLVLLKKLM